MDITYLGHSCFRLRGKTASLLTDPFDPDNVGFKLPKIQADIVTISHDHKDHNNIGLVNGVKRVINGPGEYEVSGISIIGISSFHDNKKGELRGKNTLYVIEMDGIRLAHLGDLGHKLSDKTVEALGDIDVLMIPVGGFYTIGPVEAAEVARSIEPNITIPMHYQTEGLKKDTFNKLTNLDPFLSDLGLTAIKETKLSVKLSDVDDDQKIVIMQRK